MAEERVINPFLKQVLDLGPPILFFILYMQIRDETYTVAGTEYSGFIMSALFFVPILLVAMGVHWALTGKLSRMQVFTAFMVIFFGGLTAWFNDERFFKMKTTIVYTFFAAILAIGLLQRKSYLEYLMADQIPLNHEGWMLLTRRITLFFATLAIANEVVWRTMSTDAWVKIETFGFPLLTFVFISSQIVVLNKYMDVEEAE